MFSHHRQIRQYLAQHPRCLISNHSACPRCFLSRGRCVGRNVELQLLKFLDCRRDWRRFGAWERYVVLYGGRFRPCSHLPLAIAGGFAFNGAKVYIVGRRADVLNPAADEINAASRGKVIP